MVIIGYNIEKASEIPGLDGVLAWAITRAPDWLARLSALMLDKWVFGFAMLIFGLVLADWAFRAVERIEGRYGSVPHLWLAYKIGSVRLALNHPNGFGRLLDLPRELDALDRMLRRHDIGFPPLPSTDPCDPAAMIRTRRYLNVLGSMHPLHRDEARRRAIAIVTAP